ncbi:MAG: HlyD family efflux transporter periplasmic adaptor subunit [Hominimerdicola sp.]
MNNSITIKILAGLVAVLLMTTIGTQVYHIVYDRHETDEAVLVSINEDISFQGVVVRDEKVLTYDGGGVLDYLYSDGSKISVNSTIAQVYSSEDAISAKREIEKYEAEIENLERAQNPGTTNYVQPETLKSKIDSSYKELIYSSVKKDYSSMSDAKSNLSLVMNIYDIVTKTEKDYDKRIAQLNAKISDLKSKASNPTREINASQAGYFVSYADGYENKLTLDSIDKLTENDIYEIVNSQQKAPENAIGKMFDDYSCKIVAVVDKDKRITEGSYVDMTLSNSKNVYSVLVDSVKECESDENKVIIVLSCDRLDEALVSSRVLSAEIIFDEYTGIKVPRSAIRFQGEQKGVYVILGKEITFKKINVIYEGSDYVLSENTSDEEYLLLYDQILLEVVSSDDVSSESAESGG